LAQPPQAIDTFKREVDEELRRDEALALWQRYGKLMIAGLVLALAALAGFLWWQQHRVDVAGQQGVEFGKALDELGSNNLKAAQPRLESLAKDGNEGYAALARYTQADIALQKDDLKGAAAKLAEVAKDDSAPQAMRDLALVRQTMAEYDTLQPQVVIDRLRPLVVKGGAFYGSAGEMTAIAHLRMGRRDLAGKLFGEIARDEGVPPSIRQRVVQMRVFWGSTRSIRSRRRRALQRKLDDEVVKWPLAVALVVSLGGCGIFKGGPKKTPVLGERVPICCPRATSPPITCWAVSRCCCRRPRRTPNGRSRAATRPSRWATRAVDHARARVERHHRGREQEDPARLRAGDRGGQALCDGHRGRGAGVRRRIGQPLWRVSTVQGEENASARFGGGVSVEGARVFAANGIGEVVRSTPTPAPRRGGRSQVGRCVAHRRSPTGRSMSSARTTSCSRSTRAAVRWSGRSRAASKARACSAWRPRRRRRARSSRASPRANSTPIAMRMAARSGPTRCRAPAHRPRSRRLPTSMPSR
jgi:hypothetical protein